MTPREQTRRDAKPFPKSEQLKRGERRSPRFRANAKQWVVLRAEKLGPCRICSDVGSNGYVHSRIELHHLVPRDLLGDDYAANLVPVCPDCHRLIHERDREACYTLALKLTDGEYAYIIDKMGEGALSRLYGV